MTGTERKEKVEESEERGEGDDDEDEKPREGIASWSKSSGNICSLCETPVSPDEMVVVGIDVEPDSSDSENEYTMKDEDVLCHHCTESLFGYNRENGSSEDGVSKKTESDRGTDLDDVKELVNELEDIIVIFIIFFFVTIWVIT